MDLILIQSMINQTSFIIFNIFLPPVIFFSIFFYILSISGFFLKNNKKKFNSKNVDWPSVTIQIPTYNEPVALKCAEDCLKFNYPKDKFEIIIGDDSTNPEVSTIIDDFARKHKEKIRVTRRGPNKGFKAGNLNHMLKYSRGDIIVVFDSDYRPSKSFLRNIIAPFVEDEKVGCVQAKWDFLNRKQNRISKFASSIIMVYNSVIAPINSRLGVPLMFGSGEAVRKNLIMSMDGWQENTTTEDVEFSVRALKAGYKIVYLDNLKIKGEVPFTLKGLSIQQKRWAYGNIKTFLQHANHILFGNFSPLQKIMLVFTLLGYLSSFFILFYFISGMIFFSSTPITPIDLYKLTTETSKYLLVTSGFLAAAVVAMFKERKLDIALSVLGSALTIGVVMTISVCSGFLRAVLGKQMEWKVIKKMGNKSFKFLDTSEND